MKLIEEVQIPLLAVPPPDTCRLIRWHVRDGSHVTIGEPIFDLEVGDAIWEVESFHTGHIKISAPAGSEHKVGDCVGSMVCEEQRNGYQMVGLELSYAQIARLDGLRGETHRREFLLRIVGDALEVDNSGTGL